MAIVSKRNKPLIVIQIILSLVMVVALMVLTLGNLAILPTEENERMEYYADLFYSEYALCERTELGASVDLGFIPLWEDLFELLPQWLSLSLEGKALDDLPSEGIQQCKGLLFITFLIKEATVTALYEGVAYLGLLLSFLLIPIFLLICLIVGLVVAIKHPRDLRTAYMKVTLVLNRAMGWVMLLWFFMFLCPECRFGPQMLPLLLTFLGLLLFLAIYHQIKHRTRDARSFLSLSQVLSGVCCVAIGLLLFFTHRAGIIQSLYRCYSTMDGIEMFTDLWMGEGYNAAILVFLITTVMMVCLGFTFYYMVHSTLRFACLFNPKEKRAHDRLLLQAIFTFLAFLLYLFLINASGEFGVHLDEQATVYYYLAEGTAFVLLVLEIARILLCGMFATVDMTTRLEILSGYADNPMTMEQETFIEAVTPSTPHPPQTPQGPQL